MTNDLDLVVNQWLSEYTSLYNTYHKGSDDYIINTVIYQINLSSSLEENCMLNEPLCYQEVDSAINNLRLKKACGVDTIPNEF